MWSLEITKCSKLSVYKFSCFIFTVTMTGNLLINLKQIIRDTLLSQRMAISTVYSTL